MVREASFALTGAKPSKPKTCKAPNCRNKFVPARPLQEVCGPVCAYALTIARSEAKKAAAMKVDRQATKAKLEAMKKPAKWAAEAQTAFNAWIRARDAGQPCISCGTTADVQYAAGHYRTVGAAPHLRFHPDNVNLQCNRNCNSGKAGNVVEYRIGLVKKIGAARVEALECDNTAKKYSVEELKAIRDLYRQKLKELRK